MGRGQVLMITIPYNALNNLITIELQSVLKGPAGQVNPRRANK
jgi:hypothetical protein